MNHEDGCEAAPSVQTNGLIGRREDLLGGIERDEEQVRLAMHQLGAAVRSSLGMGASIRRLPLTWTAGAFRFGLWMGVDNATGPSPGKGVK